MQKHYNTPPTSHKAHEEVLEADLRLTYNAVLGTLSPEMLIWLSGSPWSGRALIALTPNILLQQQQSA